MTRGEVLRYNLAYASIRASKIVRGLRQALTEREHYGRGRTRGGQLKEHGDPWQLSEEARPRTRVSNSGLSCWRARRPKLMYLSDAVRSLH
jgi:hypothetical protein